MPSYCSVPKCNGKGGHLFPKNKELLSKWIAAIKREKPDHGQWEPSKTSIVCKRHFKEEDFKSDVTFATGNPRIFKCLKKMVVPSIFEWTIPPKILKVARKSRLLKQKERTETVQPHQEDNITVVKSVFGEGSTVDDPGSSEMVVCNLDIGAEEIVDSSQQSETVVPTALNISKPENRDKRALHIFGIKQENIDGNDEMQSAADYTSILNKIKQENIDGNDEMQSAADYTGILNNVNIKTIGSHTEHPYPVSIIKVKHKEKDDQDSVSFEMANSSFFKENVICSNNFYCTRPTSLLEELNGNTSKEKESLHTSLKKKTVTDIDKTVIKTEIKTEVDDEEFEDSMSQEPSYSETWVKNEVNDATYQSMYSVFKSA